MEKSELIDIANGKRQISMTGVGGAPDGGPSGFTNGEFNYFDVTIDASGNEVKINETAGGNYNGRYIQQLTNKVAMAKAINGQILLTDQLTGCVWQIWKCGNQIAAAHAYTKGSGEAVSIKNQATGPDWILLAEYPTAGIFAQGEQGYAFSLVGQDKVETVIMAVSKGRTVRPVKIATVYRQLAA